MLWQQRTAALVALCAGYELRACSLDHGRRLTQTLALTLILILTLTLTLTHHGLPY